ncbi:MAG: 4-fold beta flower protein [Candidatus Taylorbacteria bacterium]
MIQIIDNDIKRGGIKIGWIEDTHIFDHTGKKVAYFSAKEAFNAAGDKIAYMEGGFIVYPKNHTKVRIEDNNKFVSGLVPDMCRAAIRLILG